MPEPDYIAINRAHWTDVNARFTDARGASSWAEGPVTWGVWSAAEDDVHALPDFRGRDVIELGCGTGYFGARLKRLGAARVVGVDITPAQLATAERMNKETGLGLEFIEASAEDVPVGDGTFDLAVSEYGASIWCDPARWIPEAARLLRPGGELVFLCNTPLSLLCSPDEGKVVESLVRPQRGMLRFEWADEPGVEFHLGHGDMFKQLRESGFHVVDLIELYASESAVDHPFYDYLPVAWARKWPAEEIWRARLGEQ